MQPRGLQAQGSGSLTDSETQEGQHCPPPAPAEDPMCRAAPGWVQSPRLQPPLMLPATLPSLALPCGAVTATPHPTLPDEGLHLGILHLSEEWDGRDAP